MPALQPLCLRGVWALIMGRSLVETGPTSVPMCWHVHLVHIYRYFSVCLSVRPRQLGPELKDIK